MALRLGPLVGLAGLALVLVRMRRLVSPTTDGLPWPLVLVAAVALGVLVIWGARLLRLPAPVTILVSLYVIVATVTLVTGVASVAGLPTSEGRELLRLAFTEGFEQFTLGTAPVIPTKTSANTHNTTSTFRSMATSHETVRPRAPSPAW